MASLYYSEISRTSPRRNLESLYGGWNYRPGDRDSGLGGCGMKLGERQICPVHGRKTCCGRERTPLRRGSRYTYIETGVRKTVADR